MELRGDILVYRIGSLGDQLCALPAFWALRENFPGARLFHLGGKPSPASPDWGRELFGGTGFFEDFLTYPQTPGGLNPASLLRMGGLLRDLQRRSFAGLAYLAPSLRTPGQVKRDLLFFRLAGIRAVLGAEDFFHFPVKIPAIPLAKVPREADLLLERLGASGLKVPARGEGRMQLPLGPAEERALGSVLSTLPPDGGLPWIAVAPGSNMPAKRWPLDRFASVVESLLESHSLWPVVVGGGEDRVLGESLVERWGVGHNLAGRLSPRLSATALSRCGLYLGNDTGVMHLAAAVGTPCVAVFSSIAHPGKWDPYGTGHRVFRTPLPCEGCGLVACVDRRMECVLSITEGEVARACGEVLSSAPRRRRGALSLSGREG